MELEMCGKQQPVDSTEAVAQLIVRLVRSLPSRDQKLLLGSLLLVTGAILIAKAQ